MMSMMSTEHYCDEGGEGRGKVERSTVISRGKNTDQSQEKPIATVKGQEIRRWVPSQRSALGHMFRDFANDCGQ